MDSPPDHGSLAALQAGFAALICARGQDGDASLDEFARCVVDDGIPPESRVQVYRNNVRAMFEGALERTFPVLRRRVGEAHFRRLAREYRAEHPSRSGDLHWVGAAFPAWLGARVTGGDYEWLADLARLEWAGEEALLAAKAVPLDAAVLADVGPEQLADISLTLQPGLRLVDSTFPVWSVWQANQPDAPGAPVDPALGAQYVVVACNDAGLVLHSVPADQFAFVSALAGGASLAVAIEDSGLEIERLPGVLAWLFGEGLVTGLDAPAEDDVA